MGWPSVAYSLEIFCRERMGISVRKRSGLFESLKRLYKMAA